MPKYKYVDGVKYRVVPQSVLGYALVREGSDKSLPAGGTDGQVLAKASNADYDVEWSTVESGGGDCVHFIFETVAGDEPNTLVLADETKAEEYFNNLKSGKIPILCEIHEGGDEITKYYVTGCTEIRTETADGSEYVDVVLTKQGVLGSGVSQRTYSISFEKVLATSTYICDIMVLETSYPGVG